MNDIEYTMLADSFAESAHHGQHRNDGKTPYITHPRKVKNYFIEIYKAYMNVIGSLNVEFIAQVALLHDVVEDTDKTLDDLREAGFSEDVVRAVSAITKHPVKGAEDYLTYLR